MEVNRIEEATDRARRKREENERKTDSVRDPGEAGKPEVA